MEKNVHINIGRQIGAGGLAVAKELGRRLGIKVYDKELVSLAAKECGLERSIIEGADEKDNLSLSSTFSFSSFADAIANAFNSNVINGNTLFQIQSNVIRKVAEEGSTIFLGRCADYVLRDFPLCLNVFITASMADRIKRIRECGRLENPEKYTDSKIEALLLKGDRKRASYYGDYSFKTWGAAASYDLCLNSSLLGIEGCADIIEDAVKRRLL